MSHNPRLTLMALGLASLMQLGLGVAASGNEENWVHYDALIKELSQSREDVRTLAPNDPFDAVKLHAGLGLIGSQIHLSGLSKQKPLFLNGVELNFGIDLFSTSWLAEGSIRSFATQELSRDIAAQLREFDLQIVYQESLSRKSHYRLSAGMAARYLSLETKTDNVLQRRQVTTPSSILGGLFGVKLGGLMSLNLGLAYRSALISDSIDRSSVDGSVRLDARF